MAVKIHSVENHNKRAITNEELGYLYMRTLGTPHPVGERVNDDGRWVTITGYDFDYEKGGLVAITNNKKYFRDYEDLANRSRQLKIKQFFADLCNGRVE